MLLVSKVAQALDLMIDEKGQNKKAGVLQVILTGTNFDMDKFPPGRMANGVSGKQHNGFCWC